MRLARWIGSVGFGVVLQACVAAPMQGNGYPPQYGYGTPGYGLPQSASVNEPSPYEVSSMPPEPLYEQMTPSPGYGFVWIDGYWHWNGYEWVWVSGRWEQQQDGYQSIRSHARIFSRKAAIRCPV